MLSRRSAISLTVGLSTVVMTPRLLSAATSADSSGFRMPDDVVSTLKLELFHCKGAEALAEWTRLKGEGKGWPIIVGSDKNLARLVETIDGFASSIIPEDLLLAADTTDFPDELRDQQKAIADEIVADLKRQLQLPDDQLEPRSAFIEGVGIVKLSVEETRRRIEVDIETGLETPVGDWPNEYRCPDILPLPIYKAGDYLDKVNILSVPVATGPEVLAQLRWVVVNEVPETRIHIAALRRWQEVYGAELVALTENTIALRVARRPQSRDEALVLAREQLLYCRSSIETIAPMAFDLMTSDWWFFAWD